LNIFISVGYADSIHQSQLCVCWSALSARTGHESNNRRAEKQKTRWFRRVCGPATTAAAGGEDVQTDAVRAVDQVAAVAGGAAPAGEVKIAEIKIT
jgi:hypothetical protein